MECRRLAAYVLFFLAALHAGVSGAAGRTLTIPDAFTPVLVGFVGDRTAPVKATDGRWHVVYELWLTNARPVPATLTRLTVLDYDQQSRVLATLEGATLREAMHDLATRPVTDLSLAPNESKLAYVALAFDALATVPDAIVHRLEGTGAASPAARAPAPMRYLAAPWDIAETTPVVLGPPLAGDAWVVANGCCSGRGAHRGAILPVGGRLRDAQRFAIDWMRVDAEGRLLRGDPAKVESYLAYDQPLLAVADGTVVEVADRFDDQLPGSLPDPQTVTIENVDGNHVILDIGNGLYVFYAHMKKGSVRPQRGERVRRGQEIGRLGNTGNSSAPHLHLHVMNAPSALAADGLPYVFDRFTLRGTLDAERWYDAKSTLEETYRLLPASGGAGPRQDELPLDLDVVDFPAAP
ncbi:MAG: M23 family metallopeptidase [bacterium]|nr:M23 family metallopeptidase [bacterium]